MLYLLCPYISVYSIEMGDNSQDFMRHDFFFQNGLSIVHHEKCALKFFDWNCKLIFLDILSNHQR